MPEKKLTPKPAGSPTPDAAASGPSSRLPEPDETPVPESQAAAIAADLRTLAGEIIGNAERLRQSVASSEIRESLEGIRAATTIFQHMADNAAAQAQRQSSELVRMATMPTNQLPGATAPGAAARSNCGCSGGCGDENKPSCCMLVYMSKVRVLEGQNMGDKNQLELILSVQAQDTWGLVPGLSGNLGVNQKAGWVSIYGPIAKFCVPCSECLTIPLFVEAMDVETNALGRWSHDAQVRLRGSTCASLRSLRRWRRRPGRGRGGNLCTSYWGSLLRLMRTLRYRHERQRHEPENPVDPREGRRFERVCAPRSGC